MEIHGEFEEFARKLSRNMDDRKAREDARQEITAHLCDLQADFMAGGLSEEDAARRAMDTMTDPDTLGRQLDRVHTPKLRWWQWAVIAGVAAALVAGVYWYMGSLTDAARNRPVLPDKGAAGYLETTEENQL